MSVTLAQRWVYARHPCTTVGTSLPVYNGGCTSLPVYNGVCSFPAMHHGGYVASLLCTMVGVYLATMVGVYLATMVGGWYSSLYARPPYHGGHTIPGYIAWYTLPGTPSCLPPLLV